MRNLRVACCLLVLLLAGCAGKEAVAQGGTFEFVSPGGKTEIFYDPPSDRKTVGKIAGPDLMVDGKTTSLDDFDGQVVVINLWAQWCAPCRGEANELEDVYNATKDQGVAFLGLNVRDPTKDKAQDFVVDRGVGYPSIYDPQVKTPLALGGIPTTTLPTTLVLDRQHRVAAVFLKALLAQDLQPVVERLVEESR